MCTHTQEALGPALSQHWWRRSCSLGWHMQSRNNDHLISKVNLQPAAWTVQKHSNDKITPTMPSADVTAKQLHALWYTSDRKHLALRPWKERKPCSWCKAGSGNLSYCSFLGTGQKWHQIPPRADSDVGQRQSGTPSFSRSQVLPVCNRKRHYSQVGTALPCSSLTWQEGTISTHSMMKQHSQHVPEGPCLHGGRGSSEGVRGEDPTAPCSATVGSWMQFSVMKREKKETWNWKGKNLFNGYSLGVSW